MGKKPTAAEVIHARASDRRWTQLTLGGWKWLRYSLVFYLACLIVFPIATYLILAVLIP